MFRPARAWCMLLFAAVTVLTFGRITRPVVLRTSYLDTALVAHVEMSLDHPTYADRPGRTHS